MLSAADRSREEGLTLIELLVVMVILGIVGTVATTGMINGMRTTDRVDRRVEALTELQRNAERITRELRGGITSYSTPTPPGCVVMPLNAYDTQIVVQRSTQRLRFAWSLPSGSTTLSQTVSRWDPATSAWVTVSTTPISRSVGNRNAAVPVPVFRYLDARGATTTAVADVRQIRLSLVRQIPGQAAVEFETTVALRNGGLACTNA